MKKHLFAIVLGGIWLVSCQNESAKPAAPESKTGEQPAPVVESPAPIAEPNTAIPETKPGSGQLPVLSKTDPMPATASPKTGGQTQPSANPNPTAANQNLPKNPTQKQAASNPSATPAAPPANPNRATAPHGHQPAPRTPLPDDAMCFVARETDGRVFEIRLAMLDEKRVLGDLLISNVQTGAFVQGKLNGERREKTQYLLTWGFNGEDNIRHMTNVSYLLEGSKLTQKSRDAEDEGRVFQKIDCGKMK